MRRKIESVLRKEEINMAALQQQANVENETENEPFKVAKI